MTDTIPAYVMSPAEDTIVFGDELAEGMLVLLEDRLLRSGFSFEPEDRQLRRQRFRRVTRLRRAGDIVQFVGEWVDGYQEVLRYNIAYGWLVKKDSLPGFQADGDSPAGDA